MLLLLLGCKKGVELKDWKLFTNYSNKINDSTYFIEADLSDAVLNGIIIPTRQQVKEGYFKFSFRLINHDADITHYWYKIYYQNETYKMNDTLTDENFYGSWEDTGIEFKATPEFEDELLVTDSFRIIGNPRNEPQFFGTKAKDWYLSLEKIEAKMAFAKNTPEWDADIKKKASINKIPYTTQLYRDATFASNIEANNTGVENNRWKRNPRMGNYRFMLVVCNDADLSKLSLVNRNISVKDSLTNRFINPFDTFPNLRAERKPSIVLIAPEQLKVRAVFNTKSGIYVDRFKFPEKEINETYYTPSCNNSFEKFEHAQFAQFFHHVLKNKINPNINKTEDVVGEHYTRAQYENNKINLAGKPTINNAMNITDCPCKTVQSKDDGIYIITPGNEGAKQPKKEQVGITSRIGFTYGKWRAKIKFSKLISEDHVWNGLTAAYWLIYQNDANWNLLRPCVSDIAYIPKNLPDDEASMKNSERQNFYSEIDFEIVKESAYWPQSSYGSTIKVPTDNSYNTDDVTVTCTNWDLACHQPPRFMAGAKDVNVEGKTYHFGRWADFSKLLTSKVQASHNELFGGDYYYYEIDWQPTRIIWRIGKDKNQMREVCRMNNQITSIPSNQMVMVLTQEFHYQEWWPMAPFKQNLIPFPKKDLVGKLIELEIE